MSTPEEKFETAVDDTRETESRESAIDGLQTANACDKLSDIVRRDDIDDQYRALAMENLAHPQCKSTLETLAESDDLPESLREQAETLLQDASDHPGAGSRGKR